MYVGMEGKWELNSTETHHLSIAGGMVLSEINTYKWPHCKELNLTHVEIGCSKISLQNDIPIILSIQGTGPVKILSA